jgi:hypothetical protein
MRARDFFRSALRTSLFAAVAAWASACGSPLTPPAANPPLTVNFVPLPLTAGGPLTMTIATMHLEHIRAIGNTPPPPPPPGEAPEQLDKLDLDALSSGGSVTLNPPMGLYSRIQFFFSHVTLAGQWNGTPLTAQLDSFMGTRVDLRAAMELEVELGADTMGAFTVTVDPNRWFTDQMLQAATLDGGAIAFDDQHNVALAEQLTSQIKLAFAVQ